MKCKILFVCFLIFNILGAYSNNFQLYSSDNADSQSQSQGNLLSSQTETLNESSSFEFYEQSSQLKAPPGGGEPIGGVPVGNGYMILSLLGIGYIFFQGMRKKPSTN